MKIILFFIIVNVFTYIRPQETSEDLEINILPSDKYRLSKRDLLNLKSDLERQMMQRVYEIQSSWDQRRKLRHFALRPPMQPSLPYKSPVYNPNLFSLFAKPSHDGTREMKTLNNPGFTGYSFSQKLKKKKDSELDPVEILKQQDEKEEQQKKKLMDEIDKKFDMINKEKEKIAPPAKIIGEDMKNNKNSTSISISSSSSKSDIIGSDSNTRKFDKTDNKLDEKQKLKNKNYAHDSNNEKQTQTQKDEQNVPLGLDYNSIADVLSKMFEKLNKKINKSKIFEMIHGKDKDQIMQLVSFIKEHPDSVMLPIAKNENPKQIEESSNKKNEPIKLGENKKEYSNDKKFFKSVSPFDSESTEKTEKIEKDETGIKYKTQARFLSTNTEIKTPVTNNNESLDTNDPNDPNKNSKSTESNSKLQLEKGANLSQTKEQGSSQFMFQDGPINLDIF